MLPRADAPARRLPYTTADMSERLAKRKAEQEAAAQAQANQALRFGVTNPPAVKKDEPWYKDALGAVGGAIKSVYENIPMSNPVSTPINMGGDAGVSMGGQGTVKSLVTEPARLAVRRAVGDITAIPRVGEPSPSYTADQIREQGVARGVLGAAIDYSQFIPVVAKGAGFTGDAVNAYKLAMIERQANPFPALRGASNVIDVVPGSRLPVRIVEAPPTPATRLGNAMAQMTLDARAAQGAVRDAGVIRFPGGEPTPPKNNVRDLNAYRSKTNQVDPRALTKDRYGFLQDENFNPITNGLDQQQYDAVFLSYNPPGFRNVLDSLNFKPYNKEGMLTTNYKGLVPLYNDQFYLELNHNNYNGMGNYVDVYKRPELWDFVNMNQLEYLGQAYGPDITRNLQNIIKDATPTQNAQTSITNLAEAKTARELFAKRDLPSPTPEPPSAQLQREAARAELGINIQDIEFPPKNNPLTRPQIIDDSGYGVFPNGAWKVLGLEQYNAGINSANLPNEMSALREYFGHDYDGFQETLRNPNPVPNNVFTEKIKLIDKIFEITPPTTKKFKVFRGVKTGGNYLSGDYLGAFYRSLEPGQLIIEPGYLSTSINKDIAQEWANDFADDYLLIINVPEGSVAVNPVTSWEQGLKEFDEHLNAPTEEELLFNRGTVLRIIDNDMGVIHAEIVPNYRGKEQLLSLSQPKEALLKRYSYKDLADMIADEETQRDFYVAYFNQQPDIDSLISKPNGAGMRAYDLADTIVELRYNVGFDPSDYWKFREIVDQISQTPAGKRASESLRISTSQKLISLFKKHQLLESDTIEFLQDNLEEILQPPSYNRLLDE